MRPAGRRQGDMRFGREEKRGGAKYGPPPEDEHSDQGPLTCGGCGGTGYVQREHRGAHAVDVCVSCDGRGRI
ncbi:MULTISPECIES: hypothetical protein [Pseudofrankia]|uniref:hypothetical protein n=1 Tax=Pseudofrankia TaxID=2994363 RepID=UPI001E5E8F14|nr:MULTISPECIES: hypothetical protein [Pseudofrankia]MDT3440933.1 hypothetical protein [Pseudofrankia sp. BMG5.37]